MTYDLFHQEFMRMRGYVAVIDYTPTFPQINVYAPSGAWCGGTNVTSHYARIAAVKDIVKSREYYETRAER